MGVDVMNREHNHFFYSAKVSKNVEKAKRCG